MVATPPPPEVPNKSGRSAFGRFILVAVAVVLVGTVGIVAWRVISPSASGDPGGRVLGQLTPVVSAIPPAATTSYVWKQEPHQDSCDGRAGTQGWSQVVVQSAFTWRGSVQALAAAMANRLTSLGWGPPSVTVPPVSPEVSWTRSLSGGSHAQLSVSQEGSDWQLDAIAPPVGRAASGC